MRELWVKFLTKADIKGPDDCWLWDSVPQKRIQAGSFSVDGKKYSATRWILTQTHRPPKNGECACHTCDMPLCVNPNHLWWGTQADNMADMVAKGRAAVMAGESAPNSKLTEAQVIKIKNIKKYPGYARDTWCEAYEVNEARDYTYVWITSKSDSIPRWYPTHFMEISCVSPNPIHASQDGLCSTGEDNDTKPSDT